MTAGKSTYKTQFNHDAGVCSQRTLLWPSLLFIALAQWPLSYVIYAGTRAGWHQWGVQWDVMAAIFSVCGLAIWLGKVSRVPRWVRSLLGGFCLVAADVLAFREAKIEFVLLLSGITFIAVAAVLFIEDCRRLCLIALNIVLVLLIVFGVEALTDPWGGWGSPVQEHRSGKLWTSDSRVSKRLIPNTTVQHRKALRNDQALFDVTYRIDADGTRRVQGRPPVGPKWVVLGGSYAFGNGLEDQETIAQRIQDVVPGVRVFNYGCGGYGTGDVLIRLEQILEEDPSVSLVVYFMIDDHFRRVSLPMHLLSQRWGRIKPRFELIDNKPVFRGKAGDSMSALQRFHVRMANRSWIYNTLVHQFGGYRPPTTKDKRLVAAMLKRMNELCKEKGNRRFVVVRLNNNPSSLSDAVLSDWREELQQDKVELVDFVPVFEDHLKQTSQTKGDYFYPIDGHPRVQYVEMLLSWLGPHLQRWVGASDP